jgi:protein O-mannosyl-transferase
MRSRRSLTHGLALAAFSAAIFLPLIGRGFVHDDFMWLASVAYQTRWHGLTHPTPTFYTPLTWLSFKLDWTLWGLRAFPYALENLLLHIVNTLLLYRLALRLWQTHTAAWWAAFGFALLYLANSWAVMWISARTHLLATLFCLAAMLAALRYVQTGRRRLLAAFAIIACCALSMLAKEIGVASVAASLTVLWYAGGEGRLRGARVQTALLLCALLAVLCGYLLLRAWAGALPVGSNVGWYQYAFEFKVLFLNLREYLSRTYLLAALAAGAIALSQKMRGGKPALDSVTRREVILSAMLFALTIAPVVLIRGRSGLYTYLPGTGAALLLGATARSLYSTAGNVRPQTFLSLLPIFLLVAALSLATVGQSWKWRTMAKTNSSILRQIAEQGTPPERNTRVILRYAQRDEHNRFPDGFGTWSFPFALQLLYDDPTLRGDITVEGDQVEKIEGGGEVNYLYVAGEDGPKVIKQ